MEELIKLIPQWLQLGAVGLLIILCIIYALRERTERRCVTKKLLDIQDRRVDDAKEINNKVGEALVAIKETMTKIRYEIKGLED